MASRRTGPAAWAQDRLLRTLIGALLLLPYEWRVPLCGWVMSRLIAPLAGWDRRVRDNLARVMPDLPEAEVRRLMRRVPDNVGRSVIESYSGREFVERAARHPVGGPGLATLEAAHAEGRPVVLVTGHFGNYDASRAALMARGFRIGGLYRPMNNRYFNEHYVRAMAAIGEPIFPRGKQGLAGMLRHLRGGGMLGLLIDVHMRDGAVLQFFGQPAKTALSAAELALKYDAPLVPVYAIRAANGLDFTIRVGEPIPRGTPAEMTQALNDSLEEIVRDHMDQWFWIHRRWRVPARASAA
ncbi:lysophospholipid acyltransferase family protein [Cereibacter sphaeroides]|uniref:lysophospholipid acyltransferase family protein n=1 Tax=Cereibacter sphaeroides TaxID=1063 RepID=UPI001F299507|nr:lysophospholipid acyltransferase family protein [Cereibacter sphaeroides]MCE6961312.1 lysophospholipid acyltransferase family protein [Cereibacter sphaeroides]MCE6972074.1 lysophospholipid acyltransferase family protein [Cereibacter sphaeroides]